jgi:hypothetical protein
MSTNPGTPYEAFKEKISTFAQGQHGIRNPFVIAAVEPSIEHRVAERLDSWASNSGQSEGFPDDVTVQPLWLDELLPETDVYKLLVDLGDEVDPNRIETTMQDQLAREIVDEMVSNKIDSEALETQRHVVLLLHLGSLYPFTRASELLDELDRRNVRSTIGIPFPGDIVGGNLSIFGGDSRHYYPAHQIDEQVQEVHLQ